MQNIVKKLTVLFLPAIFWVILTALGFGAQSLANLVELFAILVLSFVSMFFSEKIIKFKYIVIFLLVAVFLSRLLMPILPE